MWQRSVRRRLMRWIPPCLRSNESMSDVRAIMLNPGWSSTVSRQSGSGLTGAGSRTIENPCGHSDQRWVVVGGGRACGDVKRFPAGVDFERVTDIGFHLFVGGDGRAGAGDLTDPESRRPLVPTTVIKAAAADAVRKPSIISRAPTTFAAILCLDRRLARGCRSHETLPWLGWIGRIEARRSVSVRGTLRACGCAGRKRHTSGC